MKYKDRFGLRSGLFVLIKLSCRFIKSNLQLIDF